MDNPDEANPQMRGAEKAWLPERREIGLYLRSAGRVGCQIIFLAEDRRPQAFLLDQDLK